MSEEQSLTAFLTPKVDTDNLDEFKSGIADAFSEAMSDSDVSSSLTLDLKISEQALKNLNDSIDRLETMFQNLNSQMGEVSRTVTPAVSGLSENVAASNSSPVASTEPKQTGAERMAEKVANSINELSDKLKGPGGETLGNLAKNINSTLGSMHDVKALEAQGKHQEAALKKLEAIEAVGSIGFNFVTDTGKVFMDIFEKLWKMIIDSSGLFRNIYGLFDTAISLIFVPIGNKMAEILIPTVVKVFEELDDMWTAMDDAYNEGGLGAMIELALSYALDIMFEKIHGLINILKESNTGWMRSLGNILDKIVTFVEVHLIPGIETIIQVTEYILDHFTAFVTGFVSSLAAFKTYVGVRQMQIRNSVTKVGSSLNMSIKSLGLTVQSQTLRIIAAMTKNTQQMVMASKMAAKAQVMAQSTQTAAEGEMTASMAGPANPGAIAAAAIGAIASAAVTQLAFSALGLKSGGYVPATEGGEIHILAEGGEGEFVVPESKAERFSEDYLNRSSSSESNRGNTYNIYINGYTDSELKSYITEIVNEQASLSRIRAGF